MNTNRSQFLKVLNFGEAAGLLFDSNKGQTPLVREIEFHKTPLVRQAPSEYSAGYLWMQLKGKNE
jgi:hypothetical protein